MPSANNRLVGWQIIYGREDVKRLAEMTIDYLRHLVQTQPLAARAFRAIPCLRVWDQGLDNITLGAPHVILAHHLVHHPFGAAESAMALSYVDLASRSLGLGACYLGYVWSAAAHWPPLQQTLSLPENRACFGVLAIGYPEYEYSRIPPRKEARVAWR
ncbi:MAG: nitroreductase family protein [Dehalococcoidia bacterium]|nr:nitroreductase family protein [Dehalococcoidia bacterium]